VSLARTSEYSSWSMFVAAHRARPRRALHDNNDRILVLASDPAIRRWVEHETFGERASVEFVDALADIVATLTLVPPPWPQFLIIDVDAISADELALLAAIREAGWAGSVIAVGHASEALQLAIGTDLVLPRTFEYERLRHAIKHVRSYARSRLGFSSGNRSQDAM
jgi:DNA-binding response OmpR family regulator